MSFSINVNNSSGVPYYKQIIGQVTFGVINGILKSGDQLPTVRKLAVDLQVNLNTVVKAYNELELKGIVHTQQGTGTFITDHKIKSDKKEKEKRLRNICNSFITEITALGIEVHSAIKMLATIEKELKSGD